MIAFLLSIVAHNSYNFTRNDDTLIRELKFIQTGHEDPNRTQKLYHNSCILL